MTKIYEAAILAQANLPTAAWDLTSFLENAKEQVGKWGGGVLMLLGVVGLIWGGVLLIKKLMANPQTAGQQQGWGTIGLLVLVGGALSVGGFNLMKMVGSGGQETITQLGDGSIIIQTLNHVATSGILG